MPHNVLTDFPRCSQTLPNSTLGLWTKINRHGKWMKMFVFCVFIHLFELLKLCLTRGPGGTHEEMQRCHI